MKRRPVLCCPLSGDLSLSRVLIDIIAVKWKCNDDQTTVLDTCFPPFPPWPERQRRRVKMTNRRSWTYGALCAISLLGLAVHLGRWYIIQASSFGQYTTQQIIDRTAPLCQV